MAVSDIRAVGAATSGVKLGADLDAFQDELLRRYAELCECLNLMPSTAQTNVAQVQRALRRLGRTYVWEITDDEVRRLNVLLHEGGAGVSTRRSYCSSIRSLFTFLVEEHTQEVARVTGTLIHQPVTRRNSPRVRFSASFARRAPPSVAQIRRVSGRLRERLPRDGRHALAARDLALFETLYLTAVRSNELLSLDVDDVHLHKGRTGELHIRFGKGARGSGPRARWIPLLDGLAELLTWYMRVVRPKLRPSRKERALFLTADGTRLLYRDLVRSLGLRQTQANVRAEDRFSPHRLRHARASHLFASGMNLVAIQKLLGHEFLATTQSYVHVDPAFVANAHRTMVRATLNAVLE